jgi:uncharacterized damage-inducible protein DinB
MTDSYLAKVLEHNHWANLQIIQTCARLTDVQLDAPPQSAALGSIRTTLMHMVTSQRGYLALLTLPLNERPTTDLAFDELYESARASGEALIALANDIASIAIHSRLRTMDGFYVEPWVVITQVINHATEHREQIKSMLSTLGIIPPSIDGWDYGAAIQALIPISSK